MENFKGTWKFEKCENFDEYLKSLGIPAPLRLLAGITSPTLIIKQEEDGKKQKQIWLKSLLISESYSYLKYS